jgi:phosphatidylserine decarboxylase
MRPITAPGDDSIITSPADSRVVVYNRVPEDLEIWLKGQPFTVQRLLADDVAYQVTSSHSTSQ